MPGVPAEVEEMKSEFEIAITQLSADRNLAPDVIIEAIESALVSAYKRNYGTSQNVRVQIDRRTGKAQVFVKKLVTENVRDERNEISLEEARSINPHAKLGDFIEIEIKPKDFGRIAAQTAKQVITQRIREAERDSVYAEYAEREGELVTGVVRDIDGRTQTVNISLGKAEAVLPRSEQIPREHYRVGQRLRVYIVSVERTPRGPVITVSRSHPNLLKRLLELEVPEIYNGTVEVKAIAREPGYRSKVAVAALQPGVDPVGSCVGMRGVRIQNIVNELAGEKIDVVEWSRDEKVFIANALSPAKVTEVILRREEKSAMVIVPDRALSLAIGKEGQNARLAARLTGWRIDIKSESEVAQEAEQLAAELEAAREKERQLEEARRAAAALLAEAEASLAWDEEEEGEELLEATAPSPMETTEAGPAAFQKPIEDTADVFAEELTAKTEPAVALDLPKETLQDQEPETEVEVSSGDMVSQKDSTSKPLFEDLDFQVDLESLEEIEEDEEEEERRNRGKRRRDRRFVYDERLGRVVARKRHKRSRGDDWDEEWD